ncbi:MAG: hypothetical protein KBG15_03000 [Kofleriaceae bacterium]|nr:hypothetical protein [Kofleriaceae bacterium]
MKTLIVSSLLVAVATLAACNPYAPDLPAAPFRCGPVEPRCPEDYTCKTYTADYQVCESGTGTVDAPPTDSGALICNNDQALEPNDAIGTARAIPAKPIGTPFKFAGVAICPETDKDYYAITVDANTTNIQVIVEFSTGTPLTLSLLNSNGNSVATGTTAGKANTAFLANAAAGVYYAFVAGGKNNYDITITQTR